MSKYYTYQTTFDNQAALVEALKQKGFTPVVHKEPVQLLGIGGKKRPETAEIVLLQSEVGPASNEIGFKKQDDGTFTAIISGFDRNRYNNTWMTDVRGLFIEAKANQTIKKLGLKQLTRKVLPSGIVRLQLEPRG